MVKALELSLNKLLQFSQDSGKIYFKDRRMVISSADAWGLMRKDLISALGKDRAKRFLLRYGWNCGVNDARNIKGMFEWDNETEWMLAGPQMHIISGNVFSYPVKLEVDKEKGTFFFDGYWENSYEAEQHLMHFPMDDHAVCYTLLGYAGGYSSEYMGKRVIFKEVECVGKGDKYCRNVGKTVEEWGEEILEDLADYEDENLADELDNAYRRIEKQKEILDLGVKVNQKLTDILLQGKGLDTIAKKLGETLSCTVVIEDANFEKMTSFGTIPYSSFPFHLPKGKNESDLSNLLTDRRTTQFYSDESAKTISRLITPIILKNQIYGFVSLVKNNNHFSEMEKVSLERTAVICAIQMLNEQTAIETEERMKGELLDELLKSDVDPKSISRRLSYLGYDLTEPQYVFVFQLDSLFNEMTKEDEEIQFKIRENIVSLLSHQYTKLGYRSLISAKLDRVYTLVPKALIDAQRQPLKQYGMNLLNKIVDRDVTVKVTLGISNLCNEIKRYYKGYKEAVKAIEIARLKNSGQPVVLSSELGHLGLLVNARDPEELESFAQEKLGTLIEYDDKNQAELLNTLKYYVENEYNIHKAARAMNISVSGIRYRLQRIQELLGYELSTSATRFEIQLALEIFLVLGRL